MDAPTGPTAVTPTDRSSALLGYPPDARLLIVNCDDFGMYPAINAAVIESIEEGAGTSCSLMVPCPAAPQAIELLRRRPQIPFGVHLTLVCEMNNLRWGPMAGKEQVRSLLDPAGGLFRPTPAGRAALLHQARPDEIELEFRAQIDAVADAGLAPTHLDFHCLADGGRDDILDLAVLLAAEYGLAVRVWLEPARRTMRQRGLPVIDNDFLDSFSLDLDGKAARYLQLLRDLPPGLNEWAVHPGLGTDEAQAADDNWPVRQTDYEFLTSPQTREVLQQEAITPIDYRRIQQLWSKNIAPPVANPPRAAQRTWRGTLPHRENRAARRNRRGTFPHRGNRAARRNRRGTFPHPPPSPAGKSNPPGQTTARQPDHSPER